MRSREALDPSFAGCTPDLTEENLQARARGTLLMALSNKFGWLVVSTGNKSELAVGYATLYGDMVGGFALLKDVFKTDVFRLARHLNDNAGRELIPLSTIERPPSAELRADQRDDQSLPPYDLLDPVLEAYVELDRSREELLAEFDAATVEKALALVDRAEYKRRQAPPGVKLRPRAFGRTGGCRSRSAGRADTAGAAKRPPLGIFARSGSAPADPEPAPTGQTPASIRLRRRAVAQERCDELGQPGRREGRIRTLELLERPPPQLEHVLRVQLCPRERRAGRERLRTHQVVLLLLAVPFPADERDHVQASPYCRPDLRVDEARLFLELTADRIGVRLGALDAAARRRPYRLRGKLERTAGCGQPGRSRLRELPGDAELAQERVSSARGTTAAARPTARRRLPVSPRKHEQRRLQKPPALKAELRPLPDTPRYASLPTNPIARGRSSCAILSSRSGSSRKIGLAQVAGARGRAKLGIRDADAERRQLELLGRRVEPRRKARVV